jgi:purine-binding chemotaxis protein CheW
MGTPAAAMPKEFLTFRLGAQEYGIDARKVKGIRGCGSIEDLADAPDCIEGAIDCGDTMAPVVNLRDCFKLDRAADGMFTVAIVLNLDGRVFGAMVDSVTDVVRLTRGQIRPAPGSWTGPDVAYLMGVGIDDERRLILLDIEKLMHGEGVGKLEIEAC